MLRWVVHLKGAPRQNDSHAAVAAGHRLFSFGGPTYMLNGDHQIAVHVFNTVSLRWTKLPPVTDDRGERPPEVPSWCEYHTAALIDDVVYIWGGLPYRTVLYAFEVDTHRWSTPAVSGTVPEGRQGHSACVLGSVMYVYGGYKQLDGYTNDMFTLETAAMVWSLIDTRGTPSPASECHTATIIGTSMFIFGGRGNWANQWDDNSDLRVFDTETLWLSTPSPRERRPRRRMGHSAFAHGGELYVYGGRSWNRTYRDMWRFDPQSLSWKRVEPKGRGPCRMSRMSCCAVGGGDRVVFFGGYRANHSAPDDLYVLDFSPSLRTLCQRAVIRYGLEQAELPYDLRWELAAITKKKMVQQEARRRRTRRRRRQRGGAAAG